MATGTAATVPAPRQSPRQVGNTLKRTVNFNDAGVASGLSFDNSLPLGAYIYGCFVEIVTAFNAATTNVLTAGANATTYNDIVAAGDVNEAVVGTTEVTRSYGRSIASAADKTPYVKYTQTGTAATTGQAVILLVYEGGWSS